MTPKDYFQKCLKLDNEVAELQNQVELLKANIFSATKLKDVNVQSSGGTSYEDKLSRLMEMHDEINLKIDKLVNYKLTLSIELNALDDDRYRLILSERYLMGKKFEEIAVERSYDIRWVYRLHGQALQAFGEKYPSKFQ